MTSLISLFSACSLANDTLNLQLERFEQALELTADLENGRKLYRLCVACHGPEGWGTQNGSYPQIAGQLHTVTIKQLG
ncbi:MAG: c-type cytochrome, partial [Gammaproteobacteria bacterium]|nr:c-type cytochrome [Gammaproteobacteria bacterium]